MKNSSSLQEPLNFDVFRERFAKNLTFYLNERDKSQADLYKYIGVSHASVSDWCLGKKMPRMDKIQSICNFLGIEKSDLLEDREEKAKSNVLINRAIQCLNALSDSNKQQALDYLEFLVSKQYTPQVHQPEDL